MIESFGFGCAAAEEAGGVSFWASVGAGAEEALGAEEDLGADDEAVRLSMGGFDDTVVDDNTGASLDTVVAFEATEDELDKPEFEESEEFNRIFETWLDESPLFEQPAKTDRHSKIDNKAHANLFILHPPTVDNIRQQIIISVGGEYFSHESSHH